MTRTKSEQARQKTKWLRCPEYLAWVRTLPSVVSGQGGCVAHHLTGYGGRGSTKVHDFWTIPLTGDEHNLGVGSLHSGVETWETKNGSQWMHVEKTLAQAIEDGVLVVNNEAALWQALSLARDDDQVCESMIDLLNRGFITLNKKKAQGRNNIL